MRIASRIMDMMKKGGMQQDPRSDHSDQQMVSQITAGMTTSW